MQDEVRPLILVAEDEGMLRAVVAETLEDSGYRVLVAGDGPSALELVKKEPGLGLLLSDIKMPGLSGYELTLAALAVRPSLKVVLMTGFSNEPPPEAIRARKISILQKPFDFEKMTMLVDELVGGAEQGG